MSVGRAGMKPVAARPAARAWLDGDGAGVGGAGGEKYAEVLGGGGGGCGDGVEGLVEEGVGAGGAVEVFGGVGEYWEIAGVVPGADGGVAGEFLVVGVEGPAVAGFGDEVGAAGQRVQFSGGCPTKLRMVWWELE